MTEQTRNTIVGLTTLSGMAVLVYLIFLFGDGPEWMTETYPVTIEINTANGLATGSRLQLNGVDVGFVDTIHLKPDPAEGIELYCRIESRFDIPSNVNVLAQSSLLGGMATLHLTIAEKTGPPLPKTGAPGILIGRASSLTSDLARITERLEQRLDPPLQKFSDTADKIGELAETYTRVGQRVEAMLEERKLEDVDAGRVAPNLHTLLARSSRRVTELKATLDGINTLVNDPQLHEDIKATMANAREASAEAKTLTGEAREQLKHLTNQYVAVADDLSVTLKGMNQVVMDLRDGKGTAGKLVQDPALYDALLDASQRLGSVFDEAKLLIQKWKAEGLPVRF